MHLDSDAKTTIASDTHMDAWSRKVFGSSWVSRPMYDGQTLQRGCDSSYIIENWLCDDDGVPIASRIAFTEVF